MALSDPIIKRRGDRLTIRLPARPACGWKWVLGILYAAPFIAFGGCFALAFIAPQLIGTHVTISAPAGFEWVATAIAGAFYGCFVLLGGLLVARSLISRFGHSEIVLLPGRIRSVERLGPICGWKTRSMATLIRLDVVKPPADEKTDGDPRMILEAYFSDANPFALAKMYPAEALKPIARELLGAIPNYGGSKKVMFAGPPPLSRARNGSTIVPPTQRKGELSRLSLDQSGDATRVTISPYPWYVAALPLVVALVLIVFIFKAGTADGQSNPAWALSRHGLNNFMWLVPLLPLAGGLAVTLAMRTRYLLEADRNGLRVESHSPLRSSVKQWPAAEIDRLFIDVRIAQSGSRGGGSRTVRRLMMVLKNGKQQRVLHDRPNLDWVCQSLTASLQQAGVSAARQSLSPSRPTFQGPPRGFGILFALFSCVFFIAGWTTAIKQDLLLRHAVPVQAIVTSIKTMATSYRGGPEYNITTWRYRYSVNGRWYESDNLLATDLTGTAEQGIRDRFLADVTQGQSIPAWYEPGDPSKVFVVRERAFSPYYLIFMAMVFVSVGLSIALRPRMRKDAPADAPTPIGLMRRRTQALFWTLSGAAAIGHYLLQWPTTWHLDFLIIAGIWLIVSIILLNWWRSGIGEQAAAPSKAT